MFKVIKYEGKARRGKFKCAHGGEVQTPVFMNVGTQAAIKGGVSALDLKDLGCQIELSNTYHLHLRPGDDVVRQMGGLHKFMHWDGPILTDSGGFQVFSLAGLRKIKEEGVTFASHLDGRRIFMGPEESMRIQSNLGSDIAMAFDECVENPARYEYAKASCERTLRWLERCKIEHDKLNTLSDTVNPQQMLFGINQGATFEDLRIWHMKEIAKLDCDGYAIGGLAVGEPTQTMYDIIDAVEPYMPQDKPRYLMGVGTQAAIKGGVSAFDLKDLGCQIELSNTYHLHLRPGDDVVRQMGGLHKFMRWDGPILTDSGGFQVFSLAGLRKIKEEGVTFASHLDGHRIFMGPEESMRIQSNLGSDIAMAFDECVENPATYEYAKNSCERTLRWLERCKIEHDRLNALSDTVNPQQMLFGINQGATFADLRVWHMKEIAKIACDGYAIGGLAVGEPTQVMYDIIDAVEPFMPKDKPRYLMGVGTPSNIIEGVARGVDFFDCVMPARNARHGKLFTWSGSINLKNEKYKLDERPIDEQCDCPVCRNFSRAYLRHLFKAEEILALRIAVMHNLYFYNKLAQRIRDALDAGEFEAFRAEYSAKLSERV